MARAVVSAYLADEARTDSLERALFAAQCALEPDPAHALATAEGAAVGECFARERLRRFEARGCLQLGEAEWKAETAAIAAKAEKALSRRFRDHLK